MNAMWRCVILLTIAMLLGACASWEGMIRVGSDPPEPHDPPYVYNEPP